MKKQNEPAVSGSKPLACHPLEIIARSTVELNLYSSDSLMVGMDYNGSYFIGPGTDNKPEKDVGDLIHSQINIRYNQEVGRNNVINAQIGQRGHSDFVYLTLEEGQQFTFFLNKPTMLASGYEYSYDQFNLRKEYLSKHPATFKTT